MIPLKWLSVAVMGTVNLSCVGGLVGGYWNPEFFWFTVPALLLSFAGVDRSDEHKETQK